MSDWQLWWSQGLTIFSAELRKNFVTKRGFWIYLLAAAPVLLSWAHSIVAMRVSRFVHPLSKDTEMLAAIFQSFFLRPGLFFGCVGIFTYLFRGEVLQRSLHYYFLAPVRRTVVMLAKYAAGSITAAFFFCVSIAATFAAMYAHFPQIEVQQYLASAGGYRHLLAYIGITSLACLAYGAVFLFAGIRWKNPIVPAIVLLIWESINLFLPSWLKKISVLYYLRSMVPVSVPLKGPAALFGAVADPVTGFTAVMCLLGISCLMLVLAARALERMEISYSSD